jgi:hypothetical protein
MNNTASREFMGHFNNGEVIIAATTFLRFSIIARVPMSAVSRGIFSLPRVNRRNPTEQGRPSTQARFVRFVVKNEVATSVHSTFNIQAQRLLTTFFGLGEIPPGTGPYESRHNNFINLSL